MSLDSTASSRHDRPEIGAPPPRSVRAMRVVLGLLAVAVFAQAVLAGLFLDGGDAWRGWHAVNGMLVLPLLALVQVGLAVLVWRRGRGPGWLAVASVGPMVTLLVRTRALTRPAPRRHDGGWPRPAASAPAGHHRPMEGTS